LTPQLFLGILRPRVDMSKAKLSALNVVGGVCALLILGDLVLAYFNSRLNGQVAEMQAQFNQAQQVRNTAQNLGVRINQAAQTDAALRELLAKHDYFKIAQAPGAPKPAAP
jgi:hypothetical protein